MVTATGRVRIADAAGRLTRESFKQEMQGALLVEFNRESARQVYRAGWVEELRAVRGIVSISLNPAITVRDGKVLSLDLGILTVGLEENLTLFDLKGELHFASEKYTHFSFYPASELIEPELAGTPGGLLYYYDLLRHGRMVMKDHVLPVNKSGLSQHVGARMGLM